MMSQKERVHCWHGAPLLRVDENSPEGAELAALTDVIGFRNSPAPSRIVTTFTASQTGPARTG